MADYSQQIEDLRAADQICMQHVITEPVNGVQSSYPRWPNAWAAACERIHHWWLESRTMSDDEDRRTVIDMANRLPR